MLSPRLGAFGSARAPAAEAEAAEHVAEYIAQIAEAAETAEACAARTAETGVRVKGRMTELIVLLALLWVGELLRLIALLEALLTGLVAGGEDQGGSPW